jgi:hypothetical protein
MSDFRYTVSCRFTGSNAQLPDQWLAWLTTTHLQEVLAAGAKSAEIIRCDDALPHFEIRYTFQSREAFQSYERDHAPRLRADGLKLFPPETGMVYTRTTGTRLFQISG